MGEQLTLPEGSGKGFSNVTFTLNLKKLNQVCNLESSKRAVKKKAAALQRQRVMKDSSILGGQREALCCRDLACKGGSGTHRQPKETTLEKQSGPMNERICYHARESGLASVGSRVPMTSLIA